MNYPSGSYHEYIPENSSGFQSEDQILCYIEIPDFDELLILGANGSVLGFYEKLAEEFYRTRIKNYAWGYKQIEPGIEINGSQLILSSRLFKKEGLNDLNSMIVKLFIQYCTIILATAIDQDIAIYGTISIGEMYKGNVKSEHPDIKNQDDPLVMADLLKLYSLNEIFPEGFHGAGIPGFAINLGFGEALSKAMKLCKSLKTIGIFMPPELEADISTEISILSDMLIKIEINGKSLFACNWKAWILNEKPDSYREILENVKKNSVMKEGQPWKDFLKYHNQYFL